MTIARQITTQSDICLPGISAHNYIGLATMGAKAPGIAYEHLTGMWWIPGAFVGANQFTTSVTHRAVGITLDGHDLGPLLPHLQIVPDPINALTPLHWLKSSREAMFVASTVVMQGKPVSLCSGLIVPPTPMFYCGEPGVPGLGDVTGPFESSVVVGMTPIDYLLGVLAITLQFGVQLLEEVRDLGSEVDIAGELLEVVIGPEPAELGPALGADMELARLRHALTGEPLEVEVRTGTSYAYREVVLRCNPDGTWVAVRSEERVLNYFERTSPAGVERGFTDPFEGNPPPIRNENLAVLPPFVADIVLRNERHSLL
jgi:hypothetical protein